MNEILEWFLGNFKDYYKEMLKCEHGIDYEPNKYHLEGSVWAHTMMVCLNAKYQHKINIISALLHDIGKPMAATIIEAGEKKPNPSGESRKGSSISEKRKKHFRGHEGISSWIALDVLYKMVDNKLINHNELIEIFQIISWHSILFNRIKDNKEFKPEEIVNMFGTETKFLRYVQQVKNDSLGRYSSYDPTTRVDSGELLLDKIYTKETFNKYSYNEETQKGLPKLKILVGLPCSGKSTYRENYENFTIISKDEVILEYGAKKGLGDYTNIYKSLSKEEHENAYEETIERFEQAIHDKKDIIVDMTNMSKKSRRKWIHKAEKKYEIECVVFLTPYKELQKRNMKRKELEGKWIPEHVFIDMMKTFISPSYNECDNISYILFED